MFPWGASSGIFTLHDASLPGLFVQAVHLQASLCNAKMLRFHMWRYKQTHIAATCAPRCVIVCVCVLVNVICVCVLVNVILGRSSSIPMSSSVSNLHCFHSWAVPGLHCHHCHAGCRRCWPWNHGLSLYKLCCSGCCVTAATPARGLLSCQKVHQIWCQRVWPCPHWVRH